ncbi:M3 family metallopeptidase [Schumannella soli]|uniref:Zn-dependent oligopeptidase n=1 Tax=Schumannella soli TaxID=2590779 RepID=A0A506XWR6_9MICO|nr:M3 family metallopeptidase [Schumannella soli]TPW74073.1 Zn-dependent oligopeptidase [Schumannella soli]
MTFPEPLALPADDWIGWLDAHVDADLAASATALVALRTAPPRDALAVLELWNDSDAALGDADSITSLLSEVHPDAAVRERAESRQQDVAKARTARGQDAAVFAAVRDADATGLAADDSADADSAAARLHDRILRDYRRSGIDRDVATLARLAEIDERTTVLDQTFSRGIRDDVRSIRVAAEQLDGLPGDWIDAHPAGDDGLVEVTTDYPDYVPFRTYARDGDARRALVQQYLTRAWPENDAVLRELLALRDEKARLLGYDGWPDYDAEVKMIGSGPAIGDFIERLAEISGDAARRDFDELLARRRQDEPDATGLDAASNTYYSELLRRERFGVDAQEVRRYFDFTRVRAGLLDVTGRLFGLEYAPVADTTWHEDVASWDVLKDGERIGRIHLDLHPREGKYKHAAQFDLAAGIRDRRLPEGVLVCNFPRGLMDHDQVTTLFHEFGHLLHHVLGGDQRWARFSGVATEWDFVEAPSQMLEEWAWDADILRGFALDADGEPIPADLVRRMREADEFGTALYVRTQLFYSALSYELHRALPADITERLVELQGRYDLFGYVEGTHMHASFGHLGGYSSAYYTYQWSLVIAKDLFSAFDPSDLFAEEPASRYRDRVLAPGGRRDAADLVADFLGRPFDERAYGRWLAGE